MRIVEEFHQLPTTGNAWQMTTLIADTAKIFIDYVMRIFFKKFFLLFFLPEPLGNWFITLCYIREKDVLTFLIRLTLVLEARDGYFPLSGPQQATRSQQRGPFYTNETSTAWKALKPYFSIHCHHVKSQAVLFIIKQNFCIPHGNLVFHNQGKKLPFTMGVP